MSTAPTDEKVLKEKYLPEDHHERSLRRTIRLSDLIFSAAMTLMIFNLDVPQISDEWTEAGAWQYFRTQLQPLTNFIISFIIVAIYWFKDVEQFKYYKGTDAKHMWLQIACLIWVMLVPFANQVLEAYPGSLVGTTFYSLAIFFVGFFSWWQWRYATKDRRLVDDDLSDEFVNLMARESITEPIIALIAIGMGVISGALWDLTFILIPLAFMLRRKITSRRARAVA